MTAVAERSLQSELHDLVVPLLEKWKVPGVTIGTWSDGQVRTAAYGLANIEASYPMTPDTLLQIGSISKVFTATAIMQLVDAWRLDLEAPVVRYLPDFRLSTPEATEALLVKHLLTHHTGFWGDDFRDYGVGDDALSKAVAALANIRQLTAPGESWAYCNAGFQVLGALLEKLYEKPAEQVIQERVIKALGLERSTFRADEAITWPVAVGYNTLTTEEPNVARPYAITRAMAPAGAIIGTVADLLKFAAFHLGDGKSGERRILSHSAIAEMQREQVKAANMAPAWGLGWWIQDASGTKTIGHGGSTNGQRALLTIVPEKRFAIAVLTNGSNGGQVARLVEHHLLAANGIPRREPERGTLPPARMAEFAGRYHAPGAEITLSAEGPLLAVEAFQRNPLSADEFGSPTRHAAAIGETEFVFTDTEMEGSRFDFLLHKDLSVRFLRMGGRLYDRAS